jgi:hypothetical protein
VLADEVMDAVIVTGDAPAAPPDQIADGIVKADLDPTFGVLLDE